MAEMLVDGVKLDACNTAEADAIRAKTGGTDPIPYDYANNKGFADAIAAIPSGGGDPYAIARIILNGSITEYVDDNLTYLRHSAFRNCYKLATLQIHNVSDIAQSSIENTKITALALPSASFAPNSAYGTVSTLHVLDYGVLQGSIGIASLPFPNLQTLILRYPNGVVITVPSSMNTTPMKSGGAGCTVYIPKALYDHLGDGTALDYKASTTWATYDAYGTITWAQIEGSIYETQYGDGTPIPTE